MIYNNLLGSLTLKGSNLPAPEELSLFFDGLCIKTFKGEFHIYEDNNCDFYYDFTPIEIGYRIDFKVKGACWYDMSQDTIDWDADKLDITLDNVFTKEEIEQRNIELPILEITLDICDNNENTWGNADTLTIDTIKIEEWQGDNLRELEIKNTNKYTLLK